MSEEIPFGHGEPWTPRKFADGITIIEDSGGNSIIQLRMNRVSPEVRWSGESLSRVVACVNALADYPQERLGQLPVGGVTALIAGMADYLDFAVSVGQHNRGCLSLRHADAQTCNCWIRDVRALLEKVK